MGAKPLRWMNVVQNYNCVIVGCGSSLYPKTGQRCIKKDVIVEEKKPTSVTAYSRQQAEDYNQVRFTSVGGRWAHEIELGLVEELLLKLHSGAEVLEVGSGTGRILLPLATQGMRVSGVDASPWMLEKLHTLFEEQGVEGDIRQGEAGNLPFDSEQFDYVFCLRVLSLTESHDYAMKSIKEMLRVLKPGGFLLLDLLNGSRLRCWPLAKPNIPFNVSKVARHTEQLGATLKYRRGAFFFGLATYPKLPDWIVPFVTPLDRLCSRVLPSFANRNYLCLQKTLAPATKDS